MLNYHPVSQPDEIPLRDKEDAMGAYFMMFASVAVSLPLPTINLIAAIIYYHLNKKKSRFVRFHITQSLFSQLPLTILNAGAVFWAARIFFSHYDFTSDTFWGYIIAVLITNIIYFVFSIVAAVKARKGEYYYFIFFGRYSYEKVYTVREGDDGEKQTVNTPPR